MGKKKTNSGFGRTLIKDRFRGKRHQTADTHLHTTELNDGYDWNRLNLQSVTEQNTLDEFLATAELAGTEFQAEKMNITFIKPEKYTGLLSAEEEKKIQEAQQQHKNLLSIPRRPPWNEQTSAEELDRNERDSFLEWRRQLAQLQDVEGLILTPYERNLDFWRQLWRVIERSDVIVQIVDARNPLLFRCEDLEVYVKEIDPTKVNIVLVNKADFLSEQQRRYWADYFDNLDVRVCFWSATEETARIQQEMKDAAEVEDEGLEEDVSSTDEDDGDDSDSDADDEDQYSDTDKDYSREKDQMDNMDGESEAIGNEETNSLSEKNQPIGDFSKTTNTKVDSNSSKDDSSQITTKFLQDKSVSHLSESLPTTSADQTQPCASESSQLGDNMCKCDKGSSVLTGKDSVPNNNRCSSCGGQIQNKLDQPGEKRVKFESNIDNTQQTKGEVCDTVHCDTSDKCTSSETPSHAFHVKNSTSLLNGDELLEFLPNLHTGKKYLEGVTTIGLVGYPNVGKSSTINAILQTKKVPVSATPGRTKHFQTLYVDKTLMLCDCPGLVMPTFVSTKAEMVVSGILPIDQMRDYIPPVSLLCKYIPRSVLEATYGFMLPKPNVDEGEQPDRIPTAHETLTAYACMRGFMTHKGVPDFQKSSRVLLKDYVNGKLLYCHTPPDVDTDQFEPVGLPQKMAKISRDTPLYPESSSKTSSAFLSSVDKEFFTKVAINRGTKGVHGVLGYTRKDGYSGHHSTDLAQDGSTVHSVAGGKSWKRHGNRNKKEKLRRKHKDMDFHTN